MPNNNKAFNITTLCNLRGISTDSEEAEAMKEWTVLQLLNAIKAERDARKPPPPPEVPEDPQDPEDPEVPEDLSISRRVGCQY